MGSNIWYVPGLEPRDPVTQVAYAQTSREELPPAGSASSSGSSPLVKDEKHPVRAAKEDHATRRTYKQLAKDREAFIKAVVVAAPRQNLWVSWLRSASVERLKFQATFIELFFDRQGSRFPGFEYILRSADQNSALITSLDAICLVHVGTAHSDERLLEAARMTYGSAVAKVRREILASRRDDSFLVAAVYLLTICEFFSATAAPDKGWRRHIRGIMQLLGSLDLAKLDPSIRILVGTLLRGPAVWNSICERKSLPGITNIQRALDDGTTFSSSTDFIKLAVRVPSMIEKVDLLCHARTRGEMVETSSVVDCCWDIVALGDELGAWMNAWYDTLDETPFQVIPISILSTNKADLTTQDTVFPIGYRFSTPLLAPKHRSYWACRLSLHQAHLELFEAYPERISEQPADNGQEARITEKAMQCADDLCMTVAFDTQPENGYVALFSAMVPLELAAAWYKRQNHQAKLEWCRQAMKIFRAAGLQTSQL
ncbi:hypothetical protein Slin15195_G065520 [Septoria linicola]|uniref:Uncharacterized protein n=1 Tax=Septoria linicola TaxID=215465 RepID=A0A9Q9AW77_9PEZI|nr:hypothetical protein Slin14017_G115860 [Septoria linicola]USW53233.1 hypothetical protein Slin15195_G065520 [Septoria linicola]